MRSVRRRSKAKVNYDFCLILDSICFGKKAKIRRDQETEKTRTETLPVSRMAELLYKSRAFTRIHSKLKENFQLEL